MSKPQEYSELEKRVIRAENYGKEWARLHEIWLQLDSDEKNYLAAIKLDIKKTKNAAKVSDAELEMEARATVDFREYVKRVAIAKGEELRARVRYENARDLFEAGRSLESTERAKITHLSSIP